jgi:formylmethanofuran dehydrogenase subunit E
MLEDLVSWHGHLGGFLVMGYKAGQMLLGRLGARTHFGMDIVVWCPPQPPASCLLDGLQLSTGCTMGKRNINLRPSGEIRVRAVNLESRRTVVLRPREEALQIVERITQEEGAEAAGQWAWERAAEELWEENGEGHRILGQ